MNEWTWATWLQMVRIAKSVARWLCQQVQRAMRIAVWLGEGNAVWALIGIVTLWIIYRQSWSNCLEPQIRLIATLLQSYGIWTVYQGIRERHNLFSKPNMLVRLVDYFQRFPLRKRHVVMAAGSATFEFGGSSREIVKAAPDASVSDRLRRLESNFDSLFSEVGEVASRLEGASKSADQRFAAEAGARKHDIEVLAQRLEAATAGGLHIDLLGVSCIFMGTAASGLAPELAAWFGDAGCQPIPFASIMSLGFR
ncbi:hypothetical protein EZH22_21630 [Xanthobacter dioxanivorans]|uniref:Uncharacterized protein n=1 Tax=Xanthobacter dioxanivorans TaxID=2528964 RepID=A0A974PLT9_9HYPH|nr:hypothetical protein [Xanthobacter dioxanivorans]QRG05631.1 hypothetical protein EZH22_21630 [Xanthobacter dioxanivorans]